MRSFWYRLELMGTFITNGYFMKMLPWALLDPRFSGTKALRNSKTMIGFFVFSSRQYIFKSFLNCPHVLPNCHILGHKCSCTLGCWDSFLFQTLEELPNSPETGFPRAAAVPMGLSHVLAGQLFLGLNRKVVLSWIEANN